MKLLLFILLLPLSIAAQNVEPVISKDYMNLIRDSSRNKVLVIDTTSNAKNASLILSKNYTGYKIKKIIVQKGYLKIQPATYKVLYLSGSFNSTVGIKKINQLPALQKEYVQGRSMNGNLAWQGAETNELFSYGPGINALELDGSSYLYDINGRLVPKGTGNGRSAAVYASNIFRTAALLSQSLTLQGRYVSGINQYLARIKIGQSRENTFIKNNSDNSQNISAFAEANFRAFKVSANFAKETDRFSNSNRNGFLNRVYRSSILTPISFDNTQGVSIGNTQRSFNDFSDNPFFLLENNGNSFSQSHHTGNLVLEKRLDQLKLIVSQSGEKIKENSIEGYKAETAFFPAGVSINRIRKSSNYYLRANASYDHTSYTADIRSTISLNYIYGNTRSDINYDLAQYHYQRSSHDLAFNYQAVYDGYNVEAFLKVENKAYISNTSLKSDFFLPGVFGYLQFNDVFGANGLGVKLVSNFNQFNSELPISTSFSQNSLLRYTADQALQYFPVTEVNNYDGLLPVRHKEWTTRIELNYKQRLSFHAEYFNHYIQDDIFPVYENGLYGLKNIADHRNKGVELELIHNKYSRVINLRNRLSFFSYKDIVTNVSSGYNLTPVAGFSNINKAIVEGSALGAIVGTSFLKDNAGKVIIGDDGFPLVNANPVVIGNPIPDFILKFSNSVTWKWVSLNLDWEWRKGGEIWNGTQAVLDYYGRSASSAKLRNTSNYIFNGVSIDGHSNNVPVSFYDPALSFDKNRWVRYGLAGVGEEYIEQGDCIRINNIGLNYKLNLKKYLQTISFTLYAGNIIIWKGYKGADPNQLLFDQADTNGLDFFNLPSVKNFGCNVSIQF